MYNFLFLFFAVFFLFFTSSTVYAACKSEGDDMICDDRDPAFNPLEAVQRTPPRPLPVVIPKTTRDTYLHGDNLPVRNPMTDEERKLGMLVTRLPLVHARKLVIVLRIIS